MNRHMAIRMSMALLTGLALAGSVRAQPPRPSVLPPPAPPPAPPVQPPRAIDEQLAPRPRPALPEVPELPQGPPAPARPVPPIPGTVPVDPNAPKMPLELPQILAAVEAHFPLLYAIEQERPFAAGQQLSAEGAFDLNLGASEFNRPFGSYIHNIADVNVRQQMAPGGISYFAGYRVGQGDWPNYYSYQKTADQGELRLGMTVPLLRDRVIDARRARLQQAVIGVQQAEPTILAARIGFFRNAAVAYWTWVAAGRKVVIARQLRDLAEERDEQLAERVRLKALAQIERVDNQRALADRQARLVAAERMLQRAAILLSLYLRDEKGNPRVPGENELIEFPEPLSQELFDFDQAVNQALERRPEPLRLRLLRQRADVELRLAQNQTLPAINASVAIANDMGKIITDKESPLLNSSSDTNTYSAALSFDLPLQRRDARGRILAARAQMAQLAAQERYANDTIVADVRDAISALERATALLEQAQLGARLARLVLAGENVRFVQGTSSILIVTLRELAAFDADAAAVDAQFEYFRSLADFQAAIGFGGLAPGGMPPVKP